MATLVAKDLDEKIGRTIDDRGMSFEVRRCIDEAAQLDARNDTIQISLQRRIDACHDIQCAKPGSLVAIFGQEVFADDTDIMLDAIDPW